MVRPRKEQPRTTPTAQEFESWPHVKKMDYLATIRPRNDEELDRYVRFHWGMKFPREKCPSCSECTAPFKVLSDSYFARYPLIIVKAARGSGKSSLLATLSLTEICTYGCSVDILGASEKQSEVVMSYMNNNNPRTKGCWWDNINAPLGLRNPKKETKHRQELENGGIIECLTASPKTVRGRRPARLRMDEVDEADLQLTKSALGCPRDDKVNKVKMNTLMCSTHQHADGTLSFWLDHAEKQNKAAGKTVIPVYKYCFRDVLTTNGGFLDKSEIDAIRITIPDDMWEAEYENGEPATTGRVFKQHQIDFMFDLELTKRCFSDREDHFEGMLAGDPEEPIHLDLDKVFPEEVVETKGRLTTFKVKKKTREYLEFATGADFANDVDWTVFTSLAVNGIDDEAPAYLAGFFRTGRRDSWEEIVSDYNDWLQKYEGLGSHDETGREIISDFVTGDSEGFTFTKQSKKEVLNALIVAIQNKKIKCPYITYMVKEFKFLTRDHLTGKKHLPDSVASLALAWYARGNGLGPIQCGFVEG